MHFPESVRKWATSPPIWLQIASPQSIRFLDQLDEGEASALSLAIERSADLVLMDERDGREVARKMGIETRGTLRVLIEAGARGYLNFGQSLEKLVSQTRFRWTPRLLDEVKRQYEERCRDLRGG